MFKHAASLSILAVAMIVNSSSDDRPFSVHHVMGGDEPVDCKLGEWGVHLREQRIGMTLPAIDCQIWC